MTGCAQGAEAFATAVFADEFLFEYVFFLISVLSFSFCTILCVVSEI